MARSSTNRAAAATTAAETYIGGYELLNVCAGREPQESISFTELENDLGEGMSSSVLFGANTGNRRFKLSFPVLSGAINDKTVEYNGQFFTPQDYLWDLFCRTKVTGTPFVVQSLRNEQYYLVVFVDRELNYTRFVTKLFSTGVELKQARRPGVTVFDVMKLPGVYGWFRADTLNLANGQQVVSWANHANPSKPFTSPQPPTLQKPGLDGKPVVYFDGASSYMGLPGAVVIKQAFIVLNVRQNVFSNYAGILTAETQGGADAVFIGNQGTNKFINLSFGAQYAYRKNTIAYSESNQLAPVNNFGLIHARFKNGIALSGLQIGKDRNIAGRAAAASYAEIVLLTEHISDSDVRELAEYVKTKWRF